MRTPIKSTTRNNMKLSSTLEENIKLQEEIRDFEGEKLSTILKAKEKLKKMEITLEENKITITNLHHELEMEEKEFKSYTMAKANNVQILNTNIASISGEIAFLKTRMEDNKKGELVLISKKKDKYFRDLGDKNKKIRKIKSKIIKLTELELNGNEKIKMLQEDIFICNNDLINFTSKKESHLEYVKSLLNSKHVTDGHCNSHKNSMSNNINSNALSGSFGGTVTKIEEIRVVSLLKFVDLLFENSNSNFTLLTDKQTFLQRITCNLISPEDFENQIVKEISANSNANMTSFELENVVKSLIKIIYYEKMIDVRMRLMNQLTQNTNFDPGQMNITREKERLLEKYASKIKKYRDLKKKLEQFTRNFDSYLSDDKANTSTIQQMENDLDEMIKYKESISSELEIEGNKLACLRSKYTDEINTIQLTNEEIMAIIEQLRDKIKEDSDHYDKEIEIRRKKVLDNNTLVKTFMKVTENINDLNLSQMSQRNFTNYKKNNLLYNLTNRGDPSEDLISIKTEADFITSKWKKIIDTNEAQTHFEFNNIPKTSSKEDAFICEKLSSLLIGSVVYKRSTFNLNKNSSEDDRTYYPVQSNKIVKPKECNFKKFFLVLDKKMVKLIFNKMKEQDKSFEMCLSSISKIEIPLVTKSLIFIKQVYSSLLSKKNSMTSTEYHEYFMKNADKLTMKYYKGVNMEKGGDYVEMDEKIWNKEYRESLVTSSQYLMYLYLKPDDDVRVEVIFSSYDEFKHWLNGLEELRKNGSSAGKIIKKKLVF